LLRRRTPPRQNVPAPTVHPLIGHCRSTIAGWGLCAIGLTAAVPTAAAPEEIQVYLDDLTPPGGSGIDVHNNFVPSGPSTPAYPGAEPTGHTYRLTPELYYGITRDVELGLYLLSTHAPGDGTQFDGAKLRVKYIAPHDASAGVFWGANLEIGDTSRRVSPTPVNAELKGIVGVRSGPWLLALNPNLDWSCSAHGGPATVDVDVKVARSLTPRTQVGVESYNDLGPVRSLGSLHQNSKTLYAVIDQNLGSVDLNAGIGRGLTPDSDRWIVKVIVGTRFGRY